MHKLFLLLLLLSSNCYQVFSQTAQMRYVFLDNYTIGTDGKIGQLSLRHPDSEMKFILKGKNRNMFLIKDNQLFLKKNYFKEKDKWIDIIVEAGNGKHTHASEFRILYNGFLKNKVIAHRGAWKNTNATENSIAALKHAIAIGCEGSEFDIHMSSDSVPVIHHDSHIGKVLIDETKSIDLQKLKLGSGEPLPTLKSYLLAGMKQNNTKLILEIKPSALGKQRSIELTRKVVEMVEQLKAQAWVDYISFDYDVLKEVLRLDPFAKCSYLKGDNPPEQVAADNMYGIDYNYSVYQKNPDWITKAQQHKLTVNVWTVNDSSMLDFFLEQNVDFITTNEPELLLKKVSKGLRVKGER